MPRAHPALELRFNDRVAILATVSGGDVRLVLHGGEMLTIAASDVSRVYENLWRLAPRPGAVTVAGVLVAESREKTLRPVDLTETQSAIIREAIAMPDA